MTPSEKKQIGSLNATLEKEITIRLVENGHAMGRAMAAFCDALTSLAPKIGVRREWDDQRPLPLIELTDSIGYGGVPEGTEFKPFVELLAAVGTPSAKVPEVVGDRLASVAAPASMTLYVSSMCPHCPQMFRQIYPLCLANERLKLTVVDGPAFPETAGADRVKSLPTLILDDRFRWTATVDLAELVEIIVDRNPAELGVASLKGMIQDGNAYGLSEMMLTAKTVFPAFVDLLTHAEFSVRLGAMAAMEEVAERNMSVAGQAAAPLVERFEELDDQVKGDALYVIGLCGNQEASSFLASVARATENNELREAAEDALEALASRRVE
ncbi:MAG: hypothetical protein LJE94_15910 [Deltaproteobacteria bacterium]|nr:hypothetical protein [Deltaproteobacteria bacterium]